MRILLNTNIQKNMFFQLNCLFFENDNYSIPAKPDKLLNMIYGKE